MKFNQGATGPQGIPGPTGSQGTEGDAGPTGAQGIIGLPGDDGPQGTQGITGPTGAQGMSGGSNIRFIDYTGLVRSILASDDLVLVYNSGSPGVISTILDDNINWGTGKTIYLRSLPLYTASGNPQSITIFKTSLNTLFTCGNSLFRNLTVRSNDDNLIWLELVCLNASDSQMPPASLNNNIPITRLWYVKSYATIIEGDLP